MAALSMAAAMLSSRGIHGAPHGTARPLSSAPASPPSILSPGWWTSPSTITIASFSAFVIVSAIRSASTPRTPARASPAPVTIPLPTLSTKPSPWATSSWRSGIRYPAPPACPPPFPETGARKLPPASHFPVRTILTMESPPRNSSGAPATRTSTRRRHRGPSPSILS